MGGFLGWLNAGFLFILISRLIVFRFIKKQNRFTRLLNKTHPWTAYLLIITTIVHSNLMWGSLVPHSGHIVFLAILFTGAIAFSRRIKPLKGWMNFHVLAGFCAILFLVLHLIFPGFLN